MPAPSLDIDDSLCSSINYFFFACICALSGEAETKIITSKRSLTGTDAPLTGAEWAPTEYRIHNARDARMSLHRNGFELRHHELKNADIDFFDQDEVVEKYYPECEKLLADALVAKDGDADEKAFTVRAFDHNVRSTQSDSREMKNSSGGTVQTPVAVVHGDYTKISAPRRIQDMTLPPKQNDVMRGRLGGEDASLLDQDEVAEAVEGKRRYALINVWRNIRKSEPIFQYPLACVDAASINSADLRTFQIHYSDRIGENYFFAKGRGQHHWFYFPQMTFDEAMLIKQWDSHGGIANGYDTDQEGVSTFAIHSSLLDPTASADVKRESIEVRCCVIWDA